METFESERSDPKQHLHPFVDYPPNSFGEQTDNEPVKQQTSEAYPFTIDKSDESPDGGPTP